jgi:integrase
VRPKRKDYRAYRNRAVIYYLIETGRRRAAAVNLDLEDRDLKKKALSVRKKGGLVYCYQISLAGLQAILDYAENERRADTQDWNSLALSLSASLKSGCGRSGNSFTVLISRVKNQIVYHTCNSCMLNHLPKPSDLPPAAEVTKPYESLKPFFGFKMANLSDAFLSA